jgi:hypothetical protein
MPQRQLIAYGSSTAFYQDPLLVRWSDVQDFTVWQGTAYNQAGQYRIPTGSKIVGAMQVAQQGLIWTDLDLWAMQYIGQPYIYGFNKVGSNCGLIAQKAAGQLSGSVFWMSQNQFFVMSGSGPQQLPCSIRDLVFENLNTDYVERIRCGTNTQFNEIIWYFPAIKIPVLDADGLPTGSWVFGNGEVNAYVKFNMVLNTWDYGFQNPNDASVLVARTAWVDQSVLGNPIGAATTNSVPNNTQNTSSVYQHEVTYNADGVTIKPTFKTGYFALTEGDNQVFVDQIWPDMKWDTIGGESYDITSISGDGTQATATFTQPVTIPVNTAISINGNSVSGFNTGTGTVTVTSSSAGSLTFASTVNGTGTGGNLELSNNGNVLITFYIADYPTDVPREYGPYTMTSSLNFLSVRMRGRLMQIGLSSEVPNSWWRIGNIRYRFAQDGKY